MVFVIPTREMENLMFRFLKNLRSFLMNILISESGGPTRREMAPELMCQLYQ